MSLLETRVTEPPPLRLDERGVFRVGGTRVRLDAVITAFQQGCGVEEIQRKYPSLERADVYAVLATTCGTGRRLKPIWKSGAAWLRKCAARSKSAIRRTGSSNECLSAMRRACSEEA